MANAMVNRRVVAHVKVQVTEFSERAPVTAVEHAVLLHVEGAGDNLSLIARHHEAQVALEAAGQQVEEAGLQVLSAPIELVEVGFIQGIHAGEERSGDLLAAQYVDLDPLLLHLAYFPFDLVPSLGAKVREIIVERAIPVIEPLVLQPHPFEVADLLQRVGFISQAEVDVHGRETVLLAHFLQGLPQELDQGRTISVGRGQKPHPSRRSERGSDQQFGIVFDSGPMGGVSPRVIENELSHAVALEVQRAGSDEMVVLIEGKMLGLPAGLGRDTARLLHGSEPVPLKKRRTLPDQSIPALAVNLGHALDYFDLQHGSGHYWQAFLQMQE